MQIKLDRYFASCNMQHRQAVRISKEMAHCLRHKRLKGVCGLNPAQLRATASATFFTKFAAAAVRYRRPAAAARAAAAVAAAAASPQVPLAATVAC